MPRGMHFLVTSAAMRPASQAKQCFYCQQPIGAEHKSECVLIQRPVIVRATIEYEVYLPASWDARMIEFHRNDSSWCASNIIQELERVEERSGDCLCDKIEFAYVCESGKVILDEEGRM